jgi:hypothetical protein
MSQQQGGVINQTGHTRTAAPGALRRARAQVALRRRLSRAKQEAAAPGRPEGAQPPRRRCPPHAQS